MNTLTSYLYLAIGLALILPAILVTGCGSGMNAADYHAQGKEQFSSYDCGADTSFKRAADMELEKTGNWYPIYMMDLGLSRIYCGEPNDAIKAFQTIDQFVVRKGERSDVSKGVEFIQSKNRQLYDLTEREETLLHYYIGLANYQIGNFEDALVELKKVDYIAEGTYSKLPLSNLMRGLIYLKIGEEDNAQVAFKAMMEKNPKSALGYKLAILNEKDESNRALFIQMMKDSTGVEYFDPPDGTKPTIVIVDLGWKIELPKESIRLVLDNREASVPFVDVVDPDFDFGKFAGKFLAGAASYVGRTVAKQALSSAIPLFGGLIGNALLGDESGDARKWTTLPILYFGDVLYLDENTQEVSIRYYDGEDLKTERKATIQRSGVDMVELKF